MAAIHQYLLYGIENRASDMHFASQEPVRYRIDGDLVAPDSTPLDPETLKQILFEILTEEEQQKLVAHKNLDKSYALGDKGLFRVNMFWTRRGLSAVLRTIPQQVPTMADLNLPDICRVFSEADKGLVLVTGPTGSGKSTTLAAMINHINTNFPYHILTVEDPVEFVHPSKKSLVNQREIGTSCQTFSDALKYALREDPDVILLGEMRDLETMSLALTAAETGHLVFGTLHTRGAAASMDRIIDSFPANQQAMIRTMLSESLVGVISQALIKRKDKPGRVAVQEILVVNHAVSNLIREGKTFQIPSIMQTAKKDGMMLMDHAILELVEKGIVGAEEASGYMEHPELIAKFMNKASNAKSSAAPSAPLGKPPGAPPAAPMPPSVAAKPAPTLQKPTSQSAATPIAPLKTTPPPPTPPLSSAPTAPKPESAPISPTAPIDAGSILDEISHLDMQSPLVASNNDSDPDTGSDWNLSDEEPTLTTNVNELEFGTQSALRSAGLVDSTEENSVLAERELTDGTSYQDLREPSPPSPLASKPVPPPPPAASSVPTRPAPPAPRPGIKNIPPPPLPKKAA